MAHTLVKLGKDAEAAPVFREAIDAKIKGELHGNDSHRALRPMLNEYRDALVAAAAWVCGSPGSCFAQRRLSIRSFNGVTGLGSFRTGRKDNLCGEDLL